MGCSPGTPCNPSPLPMIYAAYPANCADIPNGCCPTSKTLYDGPNLPNTGIDNKDTVTVAFEKIDDALDPITIVQNFINIISANPSLAVIFCDLVNNCVPTTTTSTSTSTTTSTTTIASAPCGGAILGTGNNGVYTLNTNVGNNTGAIIITFDPINVPDGIIAIYDGVYYNGLSSSEYGWRQSSVSNTATYVGRTTNDCGLVAGSPYTLNVYDYTGGSFVATGGTEVVTIVSGQLKLTSPLSPGDCVMVIPKPNAFPSVVSLKFIGACPTTSFNVSVTCPAPLISFDSSTVGATSTAACADVIDQTYYVAHVNGSAGNIGIRDLVFSDVNGQFKLAAGYYKTSASTSGNLLQVDSNGVVIAITTC